MRKMINIRNSVIVLLCITIICMGIGYIVLSMKLKNVQDEVHSFDVAFSAVKKTSSVKGSNIEPSGRVAIADNGKEVEMQFNLYATHDEMSYVATIENKGTLPAEIVDIMESPDYNLNEFKKIISPVTITLGDIKGKIIPPGDSIDLKIVVYYNPSSSKVVSKVFSYKIGLITKSR